MYIINYNKGALSTGACNSPAFRPAVPKLERGALGFVGHL